MCLAYFILTSITLLKSDECGYSFAIVNVLVGCDRPGVLHVLDCHVRTVRHSWTRHVRLHHQPEYVVVQLVFLI